MTKTSTAEVQRSNAERQLFSARRALAHLVEMYDKGQWRLYYKKEEAFADWTAIISKCASASAPAR
jgi:hypothetical protein